MAKHKGERNWRKNVLAIGIAILFAMFVGYAMETFYPSPDYNDYCDERLSRSVINTQEQCEIEGGDWTNGFCDFDKGCYDEFDKVREKHDRNVFFVSLIIGIITFVIAVSLYVEAVSAGFMGGGILLIIYGTMRYWGSLSDVIRTAMLGFALAVLVWVGYKKLR